MFWPLGVAKAADLVNFRAFAAGEPVEDCKTRAAIVHSDKVETIFISIRKVINSFHLSLDGCGDIVLLDAFVV